MSLTMFILPSYIHGKRTTEPNNQVKTFISVIFHRKQTTPPSTIEPYLNANEPIRGQDCLSSVVKCSPESFILKEKSFGSLI